MYNGNGNGIECKGVNMESRGKLDNDEKVKFVSPMKSVRWKEKAYELNTYENHISHFISSIIVFQTGPKSSFRHCCQTRELTLRFYRFYDTT